MANALLMYMLYHVICDS